MCVEGAIARAVAQEDEALVVAAFAEHARVAPGHRFWYLYFFAARRTACTQSRECRARVLTDNGVRRWHSDAYAGMRRGRVDGETVRVEIS